MSHAHESDPKTNWDARYWDLARHVAGWSKDPNAKVGAVLTSERGGAIALGFNGFPKFVEDSTTRLSDKAVKLEMIVHAEQNALIIAGRSAEGATLYVWGKPVCGQCAGAIIQARVRRVVAVAPSSLPPDSKWRRKGELAEEMFHEAKLEIEYRAAFPLSYSSVEALSGSAWHPHR